MNQGIDVDVESLIVRLFSHELLYGLHNLLLAKKPSKSISHAEEILRIDYFSSKGHSFVENSPIDSFTKSLPVFTPCGTKVRCAQ